MSPSLWFFDHLVICWFILVCNKRLLNIYYVSGILVGIGEMEIVTVVSGLKEPTIKLGYRKEK